MGFLVLNYGYFEIINNKTMFIPKRIKYSKYTKGKQFNRIYKNIRFNKLQRGNLGLQVLSANHINSKQYTAIRFCINKIIKKIGTLVFWSYPNLPVSRRKTATRMGKGKSKANYWVFRVRPGFIFCEIQTDMKEKGIAALKAAQYRIPIRTRIIYN